MVDQLLQRLLVARGELVPTNRNGKISDIRVLKLQSSKRKSGTVSLLVFFNHSTIPQLILRVPRDPKMTERLQNEVNALNDLQKIFQDSELQDTIPHNILVDSLDSTIAVWQTVVPGKPLIRIFSETIRLRRDIERYLTSTFEWLVHFQKLSTIRWLTLDEKYIEYHFQKPLKIWKNYFYLSEGHYQKLYKGSRDFIGERIPVCATHGDFNPHNILFARSKIGIVDWENFRRQGNPFSDLIHLFVVTSFHLFKDENRPGTGFQNFFLRKNWFRDFVFEKMRSYCSELKINYELLEFFLPIHLINMGLQEIRQNPDQIDEPQIWANAVQLYFDSTWKSS